VSTGSKTQRVNTGNIMKNDNNTVRRREHGGRTSVKELFLAPRCGWHAMKTNRAETLVIPLPRSLCLQ